VTELSVRLTGDFATLRYERPDAHIDGVEIVQAIQYYHASRHLSDPSQHGVDNSVRLVVGKPALVRVYLRTGPRNFGPASVTLEVRRRTMLGAYHTIAKPSPEPPGRMDPKADPPYALERGEVNTPFIPEIPGSLTFAIPADVMSGSLLFHVTLTASSIVDGVLLPGLLVDTRDVHVDVHLRQTLRVRAIMVGYGGVTSSTNSSPLFLSPPAYPADLLHTAHLALAMYPVQSALEHSSAGWVTCDQPLDDAAGCSPNWDLLLAKLVAQKTADGNRSDVIYYGLLPALIPFREVRGYIGCERSGISTGRVSGKNASGTPTNGDRVMAHHIGHECGLLHAPGVDDFGALDPNYPSYPPYDPIGTPTGSLGEYGAWLGGGISLVLARFKDVMGSITGGGGPWLSLYHYGRLIENPMLDPTFVGDLVAKDHVAISRGVGDEDLQPMISIVGRMRSARDLVVTSVMRLDTRAFAQLTRESGLTATLRDESGSPISQAPLRVLHSQREGGDCGCAQHGVSDLRFPCLVQALVPNDERGALLAIGNAERDLWTAAARKKRPHIAHVDASHRDNRLTVRWEVQAECDAVEVWLQWSADHGKTWNALATGLIGNHAEFDDANLPGGVVTLRLLASDGFDTTHSGCVSVHLPRRPPVVSILALGEGDTRVAGSSLRLWGSVSVDGYLAGAIDHARWLLDGAAVCERLDGFCRAPAAGRHLLELIVTSDGLEGRASRRFLTVEPPAEQDPSLADDAQDAY
jgi:hypothetical protein